MIIDIKSIGTFFTILILTFFDIYDLYQICALCCAILPILVPVPRVIQTYSKRYICSERVKQFLICWLCIVVSLAQL